MHSPRPLKNPKNTKPGLDVDGVVGFFSHASLGQLADHMGHMSISSYSSAYGSNAKTIMVLN
jgi:hypothetical protein